MFLLHILCRNLKPLLLFHLGLFPLFFQSPLVCFFFPDPLPFIAGLQLVHPHPLTIAKDLLEMREGAAYAIYLAPRQPHLLFRGPDAAAPAALIPEPITAHDIVVISVW